MFSTYLEFGISFEKNILKAAIVILKERNCCKKERAYTSELDQAIPPNVLFVILESLKSCVTSKKSSVYL